MYLISEGKYFKGECFNQELEVNINAVSNMFCLFCFNLNSYWLSGYHQNSSWESGRSGALFHRPPRRVSMYLLLVLSVIRPEYSGFVHFLIRK